MVATAGLHNKRGGNGGSKKKKTGAHQVCRGVPAFMNVCKYMCVCISNKARGECRSTDSQCALMETVCSLRCGADDKLFSGSNTSATIRLLLLLPADGQPSHQDADGKTLRLHRHRSPTVKDEEAPCEAASITAEMESCGQRGGLMELSASCLQLPKLPQTP